MCVIPQGGAVCSWRALSGHSCNIWLIIDGVRRGWREEERWGGGGADYSDTGVSVPNFMCTAYGPWQVPLRIGLSVHYELTSLT